jgi:hypothetical protein
MPEADSGDLPLGEIGQLRISDSIDQEATRTFQMPPQFEEEDNSNPFENLLL